MRPVTVPVDGKRNHGTVRLSLPVTWAAVGASGTASGRPAWVGYAGQLAGLSVTCGACWTRETDGQEVPVEPGDAAALAAVIGDLVEAGNPLTVAPGPNGFALVRREAASGGTAIAAHRLFPSGVLHLEMYFDADGDDEALLPAILAGADLVECETGP